MKSFLKTLFLSLGFLSLVEAKEAPAISSVILTTKTKDWDMTLDMLVDKEIEIKETFGDGIPETLKLQATIDSLEKKQQYKVRVTVTPHKEDKEFPKTYTTLVKHSAAKKEFVLDGIKVNPEAALFTKYVFLIELLSTKNAVLSSKSVTILNPAHGEKDHDHEAQATEAPEAPKK